MNSTDKGILIVVALFCFMATVLIIAVAIYYSDKNAKITEMVKARADPMMVSCAVDMANFRTCDVYSASKK
jgi:hypothetical protein